MRKIYLLKQNKTELNELREVVLAFGYCYAPSFLTDKFKLMC